jgi:L-ribulose-5-phosphate 4-epimerase
MLLPELRRQVLAANLLLESEGLVKLTWGNVSGIDRASGLFVIKPSGVAYADLRVENLVVVDLEGRVVEGELNPSSDTPTHRVLYREFSGIGGICHTHSVHATMFCQAARELPCLGTTHADHFHGTVPVVRELTEAEVAEDYEGNTGLAIASRFRELGLSPGEMPAALQAHHAPFTWGRHALDAVKNSIALEVCCQMALGTHALNPAPRPLPAHLLRKHYLRKHGPGAYYGQGGH